MAFKIGSLVVRLLATTTTMTMVLQKVAGCDEVDACLADATCAECYTTGDNFNMAFEDCVDTELDLNTFCNQNLREACCQHLGSDTACLDNPLFVEAWWCFMGSCDVAYPTVEACSTIGINLTSGGGGSSSGAVESPPPTEAAGNRLQHVY